MSSVVKVQNLNKYFVSKDTIFSKTQYIKAVDGINFSFESNVDEALHAAGAHFEAVIRSADYCDGPWIKNAVELPAGILHVCDLLIYRE